MRPRPLFYAVPLAALIVACSKPAPSTLTAEKVSITRLDLTGVALDVSLNATNPNTVDLSATGVSSHLVVNKTHDVGTVNLPKTIVLPAGKTTKLDVPVSLNWSEMGLLAQLATSQSSVPYSVDGKLEMGGSLLEVGVPFHFEGSITHDQIAAAVMKSLQLPH